MNETIMQSRPMRRSAPSATALASQSGTIFALSSAPGRAGVAVARVSGPRAGAALKALAGAVPPARQARLAPIRDPRNGEIIDRGLVLWFPGPRSFSGEDVAEFQVHGGPAVIAALLDALGGIEGVRPAAPGEFARRAFEAGKLDLSEVEGLADLIDAQTQAQRRQALRQMDGALSRRCEAWRARLIEALARLEATIDFTDEDLPGNPNATAMYDILCFRDELAQYIAHPDWGERLRAGLYVAIVGPPNAGKSSLVNVLARRDVAIVAASAGTTRDVLEVNLDLGGFPITMADTAGLRAATGETPASGSPTLGEIEQEGMRRARARAAGSDLKLVVFDGSVPGFDAAALELIDAGSLVVLNKSDLASGPAPSQVAGAPALAVSAKTGAGLAALLARIEARVRDGVESLGDAPMTRARHRQALEACVAALDRAVAAPAPELVAEDMRLAAQALGRIAGRVDVEDVLDALFHEFCIGK